MILYKEHLVKYSCHLALAHVQYSLYDNVFALLCRLLPQPVLRRASGGTRRGGDVPRPALAASSASSISSRLLPPPEPVLSLFWTRMRMQMQMWSSPIEKLSLTGSGAPPWRWGRRRGLRLAPPAGASPSSEAGLCSLSLLWQILIKM